MIGSDAGVALLSQTTCNHFPILEARRIQRVNLGNGNASICQNPLVWLFNRSFEVDVILSFRYRFLSGLSRKLASSGDHATRQSEYRFLFCRIA